MYVISNPNKKKEEEEKKRITFCPLNSLTFKHRIVYLKGGREITKERREEERKGNSNHITRKSNYVSFLNVT